LGEMQELVSLVQQSKSVNKDSKPYLTRVPLAIFPSAPACRKTTFEMGWAGLGTNPPGRIGNPRSAITVEYAILLPSKPW